MSIGQIIWNGFINYDIVILIVALINFVIFRIIKSMLKEIEDCLYRASIDATTKKAKLLKKNASGGNIETIISEKSRTINKFYAFFVNVTSVFPLLGILGTVYALIKVAGDTSALLESTQQDFLVALTSTGWGVICTIFFKVFGDSVISPRIDIMNEKVKTMHEIEKSQYVLDQEVGNEKKRDID
jgi:chemotaxis protein MotA